MVWKQRVTSWEESKAPFASFEANYSTPDRSHSHYLCFENGYCWMMTVFKQVCFITTSYFLACVPLFSICGSFTPNCGNIVAWTGPSLSVCQTLTLGAGRTPVEWTYDREIKQWGLPGWLCVSRLIFLYWWGVSCHILSDCVQEACVSYCFMADQFQNQMKTQELQMCSNIFSNWLYRSVSLEQLLVLDLMSTGLLLYSYLSFSCCLLIPQN